MLVRLSFTTSTFLPLYTLRWLFYHCELLYLFHGVQCNDFVSGHSWGAQGVKMEEGFGHTIKKEERLNISRGIWVKYKRDCW